METFKTKNDHPVDFIRWQGKHGYKILLLPSSSLGHSQEDIKRAKQWILNNHSRVDLVMVDWQYSDNVIYPENNVYLRSQTEKGAISPKQIKNWVEVSMNGIRVVFDNQNPKTGTEILIHGENKIFRINPDQLFNTVKNL